MIEWDSVSAEESIRIEAAPEVVWDLVTDLSRTPDRNRETEATEWVPPHDHAEVGAIFRGTNQLGDWRWTLECHVIAAERPTTFEWTVMDPSEPSSTWWYRLEASDGGTVVRHGFQHGPGPSGLKFRVLEEPANAAQLIAGRTEMLAANMRHTLGCIKAEAEGVAPPAGPGEEAGA